MPDQKYTFGVVKAAPARGDFQVLAERGRRALRVHLGAGRRVRPDRLVRCSRRCAEEAAPSRNLQKERKMRLEMVGLGKMGPTWLAV